LRKPSCFGLPSIFSFTSETCGKCSARSECLVVGYGILKSLSKEIDVSGELELFEHHGGALLREPRVAPIATVTPVTTIEAPKLSVDDAAKFSMKLTPEQLQRLEGLPLKVAQKIRSLMEKGLDQTAADSLKRGENPFRGHPPLRTAGRLMLGNTPLSTARLKEEYMREFGWTDGTAASRASITMRVLKEIGALQ
jgi:hypothetical protein